MPEMADGCAPSSNHTCLLLQAGVYWFELFDIYSAGIPLMVIVLCECIAVSWVYGADKYVAEVEQMIGNPISRYWWWMWKCTSYVQHSHVSFDRYWWWMWKCNPRFLRRVLIRSNQYHGLTHHGFLVTKRRK